MNIEDIYQYQRQDPRPRRRSTAQVIREEDILATNPPSIKRPIAYIGKRLLTIGGELLVTSILNNEDNKDNEDNEDNKDSLLEVNKFLQTFDPPII